MGTHALHLRRIYGSIMKDAITILSIALGIAVVIIVFLAWVTMSQVTDLDKEKIRHRKLVDIQEKTIRMLKRGSLVFENEVVLGKDYDGQQYVYRNDGWHLIYEIDGKYMETL